MWTTAVGLREVQKTATNGVTWHVHLLRNKNTREEKDDDADDDAGGKGRESMNERINGI